MTKYSKNAQTSFYQSDNPGEGYSPVKPVNIEYTADMLSKKRSYKKSVASGKTVGSYSMAGMAKSHNRKKFIVIIVVVLALVVAGIAGYFIFKNLNAEHAPETKSILMNIQLDGYDVNSSTRIPVKVSGTTDKNEKVDETVFYDKEAKSISLKNGKYDLSFSVSPLCESGAFYVPSKEKLHVDTSSSTDLSNQAVSFKKRAPALTTESLVMEAADVALKDAQKAESSKDYNKTVEYYKNTTLNMCKEAADKYSRSANAAYEKVLEEYKNVIDYVGTSYLKKYYPKDDDKNAENKSSSKSSYNDSPTYSTQSVVGYYQKAKSWNKDIVISNQLPVKYVKTDFDNDGANELLIMGDSCLIAMYRFGVDSAQLETLTFSSYGIDGGLESGSSSYYEDDENESSYSGSSSGNSGSSSGSNSSNGSNRSSSSGSSSSTSSSSPSIYNTSLQDKLCVDGYIFHQESFKSNIVKAVLYKIEEGKKTIVEEITVTCDASGNVSSATRSQEGNSSQALEATQVESATDALKNAHDELSGAGWTIFTT